MATHEKFDTLSDYRLSLDRVIQLATRELNIFDLDLADGGYNTPQRFDLLRAFLAASRNNRAVIVLHDTDFLTKRCPRMMNLLTQFGHAIQINQTSQQARGVHDPIVIADQRHYVHRFHYDHPRGIVALDDYEGCTPLKQKFEEILEYSEPAASATILGL